MVRSIKHLLALLFVGGFVLTAFSAAQADGWGVIKGQVVWGEKEVPKRTALKIDKDQMACEKNGKLLEDKLVVNEKNKGVRWCIVYLMNTKGFDKAIPIHPNLKDVKPATVEIDQPCCQFEPHVLALREGQTLIVKNSASIPHNVNLSSSKGPNLNQVIPPGGRFKVENIPAQPLPISVACNIHPWMSGRIAALKNPYFAVTDADGKFEIKDAPAGDFRLVIWHEEGGWVIHDTKVGRMGKKITIEDGKTTDLGEIPMKRAE